MTLRSLEVFLAVVHLKNMRMAAEQLYISQPSVSNVVAELEAEFGVRLFERIGKRLYITAEGEKLASYARRMLGIKDEIDRQMSHEAAQTPLRIGATVTVGTYIMPALVKRLGAPSPFVYVSNTAGIEQKLLVNELDAALVEGRMQSPDLIVEPTIADELVLVCPKAHPLAQEKAVSLGQLAGEDMIFREQGSGTRELLEHRFEEAGVPLCIRWECNNTDAIVAAVRHGIGLAILSERVAAAQPDLTARPVVGCSMKRSFSLVYHKDKFINQRMRDFMDILRRDEMG